MSILAFGIMSGEMRLDNETYVYYVHVEVLDLNLSVEI